MKKKFTFLMTAMALILAIIGPRNVAWGQTTTYTMLSYSNSIITSDNDATWATSSACGGSELPYALNSKRGAGFQANNTVTSSFSVTNATKISVIASSNGSKTTTLTVKVGNTKFGETISVTNANYQTLEFVAPNNTSASGTIEFTITRSNKTLWIGQVIVETATPSNDPSITVNPTTITWDNSPIGEELSETISVSQANLTEGITISSNIGTVTPSTIAVGGEETDVTFTYTPTTVGDFEGTITFTSGETTATISVTGSAYDPSQVDTYELFTGDLVEGDYVIYYGGKAMKNTVTSSRLDYSEVSPVNNAIANPDAAIVWHIAQSGDYWTIFNAAVEKYAAGNGTKNQATLLTDGTDNGSLWTVSGTETHDFTNKKNTSSNVNATLRNNGTYGFACYATGTGGALTLYKKAENKAATPTLTESQIFTTKPFEVTITNNEAGATVYYTTDGNDPTTETTTNFTGESKTIEINTTTTVKAMAVVEGKANSEIASATYTEQKTDPENHWSAEAYTATIGGENTFPTFNTQSDGAVTYTSSNTDAATIDATGTITLVAAGTTTITASTAETDTYMAGEASYTLTVKEAPLATMDAIFAKATAVGSTATEVEVTFNSWVISGVKNNNAYLTDNNGKGLIIYTSSHGFIVGNVLSGTVTCKVQLYNGSAELTNLTATTSGLTVTTGGSLTPVEPSIADLSGVNTGAVITVNNVEYTGSDIFSDGENTIKAYNTFMTLPTFTNGDSYNITGVYIQYNTTKEIAPRSAADIQLIVAAPTFTPEGGDYNAAQNVEIASATAGAAIYYTLDGSDPTVESTPYSAPIELSETTTLKAIAAKAGSVSEIATAVYTITITTVATPTFEPEGGSYFDESLAVSLDCATDGATIVYTTDNWATQNNYIAPFTITETTTVKAKATKAAMDDSEIAEATYTKRYKVDYVVNGDGSLFEPTYVTPEETIGVLPTPEAEYIPAGFDFAGWSDSESSTSTIGETYIVNADVILYAVFSREEGGIAGSGNYEKVTSALTDWSGEYLIAYSSEIFADGRTGGENGLGKLNQKVSPENNLSQDGETVSAQWGDLYQVTIEKIEGSNTYLLKTQDGKYNYQPSNTNGLASTTNRETAAQYPITVIFRSESEINLALGGNAVGAVFRYNTSGYFRFYKNGGQNPVYLYKKDEGTPGITKYYTRVFNNETATANITIAGPTIIPAGSILNMGSFKLSNDNAANLIIEDGAQLIHSNDSVQATMRKEVAAYSTTEGVNDGWHFVASPMAALTSHNLNYDTFDLYKFEQSADKEWKNYESTVFSITNKEGYLYANAANTTIEFVGTLNATDSIKTLAYENVRFAGFNLIGNPFACNANIGTQDFYICNGENIILAKNSTIAPCTGIMVRANTTGESVTFVKGEETTRATNAMDITIAKATRNANTIDRARINFSGDSQLSKFFFNENSCLYIPQNGEDFAVVAAQNEGEMPVNFKAEKNGTYTITVNTENVEANYLHLIDNLTGKDTDLLSTPSYTFDAKTSDYASRFTLVFGVKNDNEEMSQASSFAYISNGEIVISNEGRATLQVIDVMGRIISSEEINGEARISTNGMTAGVYVLNLNGNVQKIVVR